MLTPRDIFLGMVLPLVVSAGILLLGRVAVRRKLVGAAIGIGLGFAAGYAALFGMPKLPPGSAFAWLFYVVPAVAVVATVGEAVGFGRVTRWAVGLAAAAVVVWLLVSPLRAASRGPGEGWVWLAGLAVLGWVWWGQWDELVRRSPGPWAGMVMTGVAGFTSLLLMLSDSLRFGQMGLAVTGATAGAWVAGWLLKRDVWRGAGAAWAAGVFGLLLNGHYWAGLTTANAALLLVAPAMAWVGEVRGVRDLKGWKRSAVRVALVIVAVLVATVLAVIAFQQAEQASDGSEYY